MKKNISINLQGLIFHIEEDGYEQLRQYLAAIKTYFSNYEGHEEIVADIEGRIAEVFSGKLNPGKQVITQEDVQALITQMGNVQDFAQLEEEEDLTQKAYHTSGSANASSEDYQQQSTTSSQTQDPKTKRLFRDQNNKVISGVSAGIAHYLNIDPLWIRLTFVLFFVLGILTAGISAGFVTLVYVIFWIALPPSYTLTEVNSRKLFRDPDDKKLGGVASGLALYLGMDVAVIRLLFLLSVLFGGLGIPIYIVLWLVVPLATTITEKVQMQGNPITLSGIEESLKNNLRMRYDNGQESNLARVLLFPVRLVAQVLEALAKALRPLLNFLGSAIRIIAGIILMFIALGFIFALFIGLGAGTGLLSENYINSDFDGPMQLFTRDFPEYGMFAGFIAGLIPSVFLLMIAIGLLTKRFFLKPLVGWSMFAVWVVSLFVMGTAIFTFQQNFSEYGEYVTEKTYPAANYKTMLLDARNTNSSMERWVNVEFESINGSDLRVMQEFNAKGRTEADAIRNAQMLTYRIQQRDSVFIFDRQARLPKDAAFRDQGILIKVYLPQSKRFRLSRNFIDFVPSSYFQNDYDYDQVNLTKALWEFNDGKFICPTCTVKAEPREDEHEEEDMSNGDFTPDFNNDIDHREGNLVNDWDEYGSEEKSFSFTDFKGLKVGGAYHVRVKKGDQYLVRARGDQEGISNLIANQNGNTLEFKSDEDFWDFNKNNRENVLIEITMPHLENADFSGAIKSEISGFEENNCRISQSGAVQTMVGLNADKLELDLSGAAKISLNGKTEDLQLQASGACNVQASGFRARNADVNLSGASKANIYVTERLKADASGVSNVRYSGNPNNVTTDVSGASKVSKQ